MTATLDAPPRTTDSTSTSSTVTLTIARQALRAALARLAGAVGSGAKALPVAQHIRLQVAPGQLTLTAMDFDTWATLTVPCDASAEAVALLPAKRLTELVANLPPVGAVTLALSVTTGGMSHQRAVLSAGRARFEIAGMAVEDFPEAPAVEAGTARATVNAAAFLDALGRAVPHASTADSRPSLNVVRLEGRLEGRADGNGEGAGAALGVIAFEGHHMARLSVPASAALPSCSLHRTSVPILARLFTAPADDATLSLATGDGRMIVEGTDARCTVRLVDLPFPDYLPAIAALRPSRTVVCDRLLLSAAIRRVALVTDESRRIALVLGDELTITGTDATQGAGADVVPIEEQRGEADRTPRTFDLNASAALIALDTLTASSVAIALDTADKPVLFQPADATADPITATPLVLAQPLIRR